MTAAGLWPREAPRPTSSVAERNLYDALQKGLPRAWSAWHSLRLATAERTDREGDFVLAIPERGLLVLEVKGGVIEVRDGRWFQNGTAMTRAPREQALGFVRVLVERLGRAGFLVPAFGVATCFPDRAFSAPPSQDDLHDRVLGAQDLPWLAEALPALVERALPPARPATSGWIDQLHSLWGETWPTRITLGHRALADEHRRTQLDAVQLDVLDALADNDRVLIEGGAGSGKTILAREVALRMARAKPDARVELLCFTAPLARWLRETIDDPRVHVATVRGRAREIVEQAGTPVGVLPDEQAWEALAGIAALDSLPLTDIRPDAVVIDESQDFGEWEWELAFALAGTGRLWAFGDAAQGFWARREVPRARFPTVFRLGTRYRCAPAILALADRYLGRASDDSAVREGFERGVLRLAAAPSTSAVAERLEREIDKLLGEGLQPGDIAVLSLRGLGNGTLPIGGRLGRHALVRADAPSMGENVVGDTFLRFKGLERPAVLVTDLPDGEALERLPTRMHIALTRAMSAVRVVASRDALMADPVLAPWIDVKG